jgi:endonuclease/exonuclease/phosphatase (EEP) superfamily protein YafD
MRKRWWLAGACAVFALINGILVIVQFIPDRATPQNTGPSVKLVSINVHTSNQDTDRVLRFLEEVQPDLVLLMEVDQHWLNALDVVGSTYPFHISEPRDDNFGIALLSRLPLTNEALHYLGAAQVPSVAAEVHFDGGIFHLLGTHPLPPGSSIYARHRNEQLARIADHAREQHLPVVVLGDLNVTPWSPYFKEVLRDGELRDSAKGRGIMGSWPAGLPLLRIPLDHCLVSPSVQVTSRWLGPKAGGDHLPLVVELVVPTAHDVE